MLPAAALDAASETSSAARRVALVFDDGPFAEQTPRFLELLRKENVRVTFSYVGRNAAAHPDLARAAVEAGHEIANHSYTHPHLRDLDDDAVRHEITAATAAIEQATGRAPRWFWAPYLEWNDRLANLVQAAGLEHFPYRKFHFISTDDWNPAVPGAAIRHRATSDVRDRTVILCHEWRKETLAELPAIIAELKEQGCRFVTFSELIAAD